MTARRLCMGLAAAGLLLVPSTAAAAKKSPPKVDKKAPTVLKVTPTKAKVGDLLVVTGRNFVRGNRKNQVFFFTKGGGTWTTAESASATRLKVRVPEKLANLLPANGDDARVQLRVKGKRLGDRSATRVSPLISIRPTDVGGDITGGGTVTPPACAPDPANPASDVDSDLLTDARERDLLTDPCNRDSDGDRVSDGYEYYSALDQNNSARPYPGKRPYPNALDPDADKDYDGDGLTSWDEYSLWMKYGQGALPMNYSAGLQRTVAQAAPAPSGPLYYMDLDGDGWLSDDERDADGDLLGNWDESHGRMQPTWWASAYNKDPFKETPYPITFAGTDMLDPDSDGDGVADGADDQDFDGLTNAFEIERLPGWDTTYIATGYATRRWDSLTGTPADPDDAGPLTAADARYYARVQPFNPCKPVWSDRCHLHPPFGYYADDEPWAGAKNPPAPGARPDEV